MAHRSFPTVLSLVAAAAVGHRLYSECDGDCRRRSGSQTWPSLVFAALSGGLARHALLIGLPSRRGPVISKSLALEDPGVLMDDTPITSIVAGCVLRSPGPPFGCGHLRCTSEVPLP